LLPGLEETLAAVYWLLWREPGTIS
jgi:hypothetical protein